MMTFEQLTGWIDYDRPYLPNLTAEERIDYFEKRVHLVAIHPLDRLLTTEIHVSPESSALLVYGVAICCVIEATGKFLTGSKVGNRERFEAFLHRYMSPAFQAEKLGSATYGEVLWLHFRNGLTHGFAVRHGGFERNRGQAYFDVKEVASHKSLSVNPFLLYDDFVSGFGRYLSDLRASQPNTPPYSDFDIVFQEVFVLGH